MPGRDNDQDHGNVKRRRFLQGTGAGAIAVGLAGCSGNPTETDTGGTPNQGTATQTTPSVEDPGDIPEGGTFTYGMTNKPESNNITQSGQVYDALALLMCYEGPIASHPKTDLPKPWLYTDWKLEKNAIEEGVSKAYFNMRDDVKFGDGSTVTADDVLFTYDYFVKNNVAEYASVNDNIVHDDQRNPAVKESDTDWDFEADIKNVISWQFSTIGAIDLLPKSVWEGTNPQQFNPMENDQVFGMGPMKMTQYDPDTVFQVKNMRDQSNYKSVLNNQQWVQDTQLRLAGGPFVDKVNFQVFGSQSSMTNAFLNGDIDTHYGSISTSRLDKVRNTEGRTTVRGPDSGFSYFGFNMDRKPTDDATLRQAMNFAWDDTFWVRTLQRNSVINGDYSQSAGYKAARPETYGDDVDYFTAPETDLYAFRGESEGSTVVDKAAIRDFLTSGTVADGSSGSFAGMDYPGAIFDDVSADQSSSKYDYSFGSVQSQVLKEANADKEIRVNGKTIPEFTDGNPLRINTDPPSAYPRQTTAIKRWVTNLRQIGIPVQMKVMSTNTLYTNAYGGTFDIMQGGWAGTGPFGGSNYFFHHSDWNTDSSSTGFNFTGYGAADQELSDAYHTMDPEAAAEKFAKSIEQIYFDSPYRVYTYAQQYWPMNSEKWKGYVQGVVGPTYASWFLEINNIHKRNA